jgi:hypothetical protein
MAQSSDIPSVISEKKRGLSATSIPDPHFKVGYGMTEGGKHGKP